MVNNSVLARAFGYALVRDKGGSANLLGRDYFSSNLCAIHKDGDGKEINAFDFGSGKITEQFVFALAKDFVGTTNNKAAPILTQLKYMYSGTGSTAETAYDYGLGTAVNVASASITPTLAVVASSNNVSMQWAGTINYVSGSAITEWGLFNANVNGSQYNTSTDTFTATTITPTSSPSWTTNTWAGYVAIAGTTSGTANNSGAAYYGAFIESNSATALTIAQATNDGLSYWTVNNNGGVGSTPAGNSRFDIWPLMSDRKTFSAINVISGDSITFTYTLTLQSGG